MSEVYDLAASNHYFAQTSNQICGGDIGVSITDNASTIND
jgi:hypothetical protein